MARATSRRKDDWADFLLITDVVTANAQKQGIVTGEDFARLVKRTRQQG